MDGVSYAYANNNPLKFIDPLGLEAAVVFYGEEYREGSDSSAWQDKAELSSLGVSSMTMEV